MNTCDTLTSLMFVVVSVVVVEVVVVVVVVVVLVVVAVVSAPRMFPRKIIIHKIAENHR